MNIIKRAYKLASRFYVNAYAVGYRFNTDKTFTFDNPLPYHMIMPTKHEWYADPFPFIYEGKHYIFAEVMKDSKNKGVIGVYCIENPELGFVDVLEEPFHLSYPCIFNIRGKLYMIPETHEAKQVRLYENVQFPSEWKLRKIIIPDVDYVDSSVLVNETKIYIESFDLALGLPQLHIFDFETDELSMIKGEKDKFIQRRPGGNFIRYGDGVIHTLQNCDNAYGAFLHIAKVERFDKNGLEEIELGKFSTNNIRTNAKCHFIRNHTFNKCGEFEVIDVQYHQLNLFNNFK